MPKTKWTFKPAKLHSGEAVPQHYFATSVAEWKTGDDPATLIDYFKRQGYDFSIWLVPLPEKSDYQISYFVPQVKGCTLLGTWAS